MTLTDQPTLPLVALDVERTVFGRLGERTVRQPDRALFVPALNSTILRITFGDEPGGYRERGWSCRGCGCARGQVHRLGCINEVCPRHLMTLQNCGDCLEAGGQ